MCANIVQFIAAISALLGPGWRALAPTLVDRRARAVGHAAHPRVRSSRSCCLLRVSRASGDAFSSITRPETVGRVAYSVRASVGRVAYPIELGTCTPGNALCVAEALGRGATCRQGGSPGRGASLTKRWPPLRRLFRSPHCPQFWPRVPRRRLYIYLVHKSPYIFSATRSTFVSFFIRVSFRV